MSESEKPSEAFPIRLEKARKIRKLSQSDLASRSGLPASSISNFESGKRKPSFQNLKKLSKALEASTDFLLGRVDELDADASVAADPLYRGFKNLSQEDRELTSAFIEMLADRSGGDDETS